MLGLFEAVCAPWQVERRPRGLLVRRAAAGLGPDGPVPGEGDGAGPGLARGRRARSSSAGRRASRPTCQPVVGEAPELRNYFVAAGLNSIGILTGGGLGPGAGPLDRRRPAGRRRHRDEHRPAAHATRRTRSTGATRTVESLGMVYQCHYPSRSMQTARDAKRSAAARPARRARRVLPGRQRLGGRRLVRAGGRGTRPEQLSWGRQNWFALLGGRAPRGPRGRDPHGHVVHVEVPRAGARRRRRAATTCPPTRSTASRASSRTPSGSTRAARSRPT